MRFERDPESGLLIPQREIIAPRRRFALPVFRRYGAQQQAMLAQRIAAGWTPPSGLVGWWKCNEGSGSTAADSSGNSLTGTLVNSPAWVTGHLGSDAAIQFTAASSQAVTTPSFSLASGAFTICGWININWQNLGGKFPIVFAAGIGASDGINLSVAGGAFNDWQTNDVLAFGDGYLSGQNPRGIADPGIASGNSWHHLAGVLDGSSAVVYVDGSAVSMRVAAAASVPSLTATGTFGGAASTSDYSDMTSQQIMLFNRVLSGAEILDVYNHT